MPDVSVVIPLYNEVENLATLVAELDEMTARSPDSDFEIVLVDDASTDGSRERLSELARRDRRYVVVRHGANAGQSAALLSGFAVARGEVVVTLDGDLQNPPGEVPRLLAALEGFDVVSGVRAARRDSWLIRTAGRIANRVRSAVLHDGVRDVGCSLKAYRRELLTELPAFNGLHRFLPAFLVARGARIVEIPVAHRPREHGQSNYSIHGRLWRGIADLLGVRWLIRRSVHHRAAAEEDLE